MLRSWEYSGLSVTRLLHRISHVFLEQAVPGSAQTDRKRMQKLRKKKTAMAINWMTMRNDLKIGR